MGLNIGQDTAEIHGKSVNPLIIKSNTAILWWILIFVLMLFGIAAVIYQRQKKLEKQRNSTIKLDASKKRYKNGVEVGPNEAKLLDAQDVEKLDGNEAATNLEEVDLNNDDKTVKD